MHFSRFAVRCAAGILYPSKGTTSFTNRILNLYLGDLAFAKQKPADFVSDHRCVLAG